MFTKISILFVLLFSTFNLFAQSPNLTAPTNWENYRFGEKEISVLLPKMPVRDWAGDSCRGEETRIFGAYSDKVVYVFRLTNKVKVPRYCDIKEEFGKQNFERRTKELKSELTQFPDIEQLTKSGKDESKEVLFSGKTRTYRLINDFENNRWFEFWAIGANESKPEVKNFLVSLKLGKDSSGKEIGNGSPFTVGDEKPATEIMPNKSVESNPTKEQKEIINTTVFAILKPRPGYTEAARLAQMQGTVRLRVTFHSTGNVGSISVISGLEKGLTEKAIEAAKKIVFLPATRNGVNITIIKEVAYTFNLL